MAFQVPPLPLPLDKIIELQNFNLIGFAMLILLPRFSITRLVVFLMTAFWAAAYVWNIAHIMTTSSDGIKFDQMQTLDGLTGLFSNNKPAIFAAWTHMLPLDLWTSRWIIEDAPISGVPHLLAIPAVVGTCLFGPAGLLLYFIIRTPFLLFSSGSKPKTE
eukprot:TRINITY_DN8221_c0_g1_i1.p1 TRINITY_DN8221_c0_g1~~TRINITY_DN8221_c0_g1_i1.p1  ORF type:complete len:160 (-),score=29.75 TRINITY_DN8221_c0_g1_i1:235-714(-)